MKKFHFKRANEMVGRKRHLRYTCLRRTDDVFSQNRNIIENKLYFYRLRYNDGRNTFFLNALNAWETPLVYRALFETKYLIFFFS